MLHWIGQALWVLLALFVVFDLFLMVLKHVGWRIPFEEVHGYVEFVMRAGGNRARLLLRSSGHRLDFVKLIPRDKPTRFLLALDKHFGSAEDFAAAKAWLHDRGIGYQDASCSKNNRKDRRLNVEIGQDVALGARVALGLFGEVLRVSRDAGLRFGHAGPINVRSGAVVGWDDPDAAEGKRKERDTQKSDPGT